MKEKAHSTCFGKRLPVDFHEFLHNRKNQKVKVLRNLKVGLYEVGASVGKVIDLYAYEKDGWLYDIGGHGHPIDAYQIGIDVEKIGDI